MPPLPRRAMGPDRNCRQLDCPVPIAHRGRGSAEVGLKATFSYKTAMGRPYYDLGLPTTKHERVLGLSTLSYKTATGRPHADLVLPATTYEKRLVLSIFFIKPPRTDLLLALVRSQQRQNCPPPFRRIS